ncbi:MAG: hypothetical protein J6M02_01250 [Clostridia bacterium]|nr:hypothetical protein [Clostridia bacterium]
MGVTSIEMQVMIPKTVEVAKQQSSQAHQVNAGQQNTVQKEQELQQENTKRVHDRNNTEKIYVDEEEKEEKEKKEKEKDKKKSNTNSEKEDDDFLPNEVAGRNFDASV